MLNDYLEWDIGLTHQDHEAYLWLYMKDGGVIILNNVTHNPTEACGLLDVSHKLYGKPVESHFRSKDIKYITANLVELPKEKGDSNVK